MCLNHLHTRILETSADLYAGGHFASAIFEAFKAVEERIREMIGVDLSGVNLMNHAFGGAQPMLQLNALDTHIARDEQRGFHQVFAERCKGSATRKHTLSLINRTPSALSTIWV